jgi:hypothetical protein
MTGHSLDAYLGRAFLGDSLATMTRRSTANKAPTLIF